MPCYQVNTSAACRSAGGSAGQPVVQVAGRLGVLQQRLGDVVQVLLVGQPVAGVHVVAVHQQALHVGGDAGRNALQPERDTTASRVS